MTSTHQVTIFAIYPIFYNSTTIRILQHNTPLAYKILNFTTDVAKATEMFKNSENKVFEEFYSAFPLSFVV
jgi:tellurite resistance protein